MKMFSSLQGWSFIRTIALVVAAAIITGCGGEGVGTGGTGSTESYSMGGAIQGKALALTNTVTTIAGTASTVAGTPSSADGTGVGARFSGPSNITTDGANLYVADSGNCTIRKIVISTGVVTTLAGAAGPGRWADGIGAAARFNNPQGITTDGTNLYVAEFSSTIRKIVIATGEVTTLAGSADNTGAVDGIGSAARFYLPTGITTDGTNLYVTDSTNSTIRKIVIATGAVSTLAGSAGVDGSANGAGVAARFSIPYGITTDGTNLYVADSGNNAIRKIVIATGTVTTLAAGFSWPTGITTDGANLYVADTQNNTIRKIVISNGVVTTLAGTSTQGSVDGSGTAASFGQPQGITTDGTNLYVADTKNNSIRKVVIASGAVTTMAGTVRADGIAATANFFSPWGITTDGANLYVANFGNNTISKTVIATGVVTTLAGAPSASSWADGTGAAARFSQPMGITTEGTNLYVVDGSSCTIRKIEISTGVVTTLAGDPNKWGAIDGTGTAARFYAPSGITNDEKNLYVADRGNRTIRKIEISTGIVTTLAGTAGTVGSTDGTGAAANFSDLLGITTDGTNLYVADNHAIRKIVISTGVVTTVAGSAESLGWSDGIGAAARFYITYGITTDGTNLYLTDAVGTIRKMVISTGDVTTLAGTPWSVGSADGTGAEASFRLPMGITTDGTSLYVADSGNNMIRKIQ